MIIKNFNVFTGKSWLELNKKLLNNSTYQSLTLDSKAVLPLLCALADSNGLVSYTFNQTLFKLNIRKNSLVTALKELKEKGFIDYKIKKISVLDSDNIAVALSALLFDLIKSNSHHIDKPDLNKWAIHIHRLIHIDGKTPEEIESVIKWSQSDLFWRSNILSTLKLRRKFDFLLMRMNSKAKKVSSPYSMPVKSSEKKDPYSISVVKKERVEHGLV